MSGKSVEALRIFFSGGGIERYAQKESWKPGEIRIIPQAMKTAHTVNLYLALIREVDTIIHSLQQEFPSHDRKEPVDHHKSPIGELFNLRYHAVKDPLVNPDTLLEFFYWEYKQEYTYRAILMILFLLTYGFYLKHLLAEKHGLNAAKLPTVQYLCRSRKKHLPKNPEELKRVFVSFSEGSSRLGYWLSGGTVYYLLKDRVDQTVDQVHITHGIP